MLQNQKDSLKILQLQLQIQHVCMIPNYYEF